MWPWITLNNPPVNGMGYDTRLAMVKGVEQAVADPAVKAIVITGHGKGLLWRCRHSRIWHTQGPSGTQLCSASLP